VVPFIVTVEGLFAGINFVDGSNKATMVELRGLEPLTPCMPCRCATSCATAPNSCVLRIILRKQLDYLKPQSRKTPIRPEQRMLPSAVAVRKSSKDIGNKKVRRSLAVPADHSLAVLHRYSKQSSQQVKLRSLIRRLHASSF